MNDNVHIEPRSSESETTRGVIQRGIQVLVVLLIYAAALFLPAGRLDWPMAWAYLGV